MTHDEMKLRIGANITAQRKRLGMTQAELAMNLNYSAKAVSKWERGESVPDVLTLADIARQFGVTVNELVYGPEELPPSPLPEPEPPAAQGPDLVDEEEENRIRHNRRIIQQLVSILVWVVALAIYVMVDSFDLPCGWLIFFVAIPANAITLLSLRCAWKMYSWNLALISVIMWGSLVCVHSMLYLATGVNTWRLFLMGLLGQTAIVLWFKLVRKPKEKKHG